MAMQISNWLSEQLLNAVLRNVPFVQPEKVYLALFTSDPTAANTGQEVTGGGYERQTVEFAEPELVEVMLTNFVTKKIDGKTEIVAEDFLAKAQTSYALKEVEFPVATGNWGLVTHFGLYDAETEGHLLFATKNEKPRTVETGDMPKLAADGISVKFIQ